MTQHWKFYLIWIARSMILKWEQMQVIMKYKLRERCFIGFCWTQCMFLFPQWNFSSFWEYMTSLLSWSSWLEQCSKMWLHSLSSSLPIFCSSACSISFQEPLSQMMIIQVSIIKLCMPSKSSETVSVMLPLQVMPSGTKEALNRIALQKQCYSTPGSCGLFKSS